MIIELPLTKGNRIKLARAFRDVPRVDIAIECVLEAQMGCAFVEDAHRPTVFKIVIGSFTYFAGEVTSPGGQEMIESIAPYSLLMAAAPGWFESAQERYGERLVAINRYSFSSEAITVTHLANLCQVLPFRQVVKKMDAAFAASLWGQEHFIDFSDFDSPEDWQERGIGFYLEEKGEVIGAAYSSLVCSQGIEVSIFVRPDYRRQGVATVLAASLVKWCLEHKLDAHWDAANLESCGLAEKLGYRPTGRYQAYYLKG
jgi:RimJ/RimL family protein N-acetyltransferase